MKNKSIAQYLEFANLQIAAEAFYEKINDPPNWKVGSIGNVKFENLLTSLRLEAGNDHNSKFSPTLAAEFTQKWEMVAHIANTGTGFSGTLFEALDDIPGTEIKKGDLTLSFRSTEFVEDAVRDNRATNKLEINDKGFAFGQITDMIRWVEQLKANGLLPAEKHLNVTGYSLGAHLATALNIWYKDEGLIDSTYTFNGAGVGWNAEGKEISKQELREAITKFWIMRESGITDQLLEKMTLNNTVVANPKEDYAAVSTLLSGKAVENLKNTTDISEYLKVIAEAETYITEKVGRASLMMGSNSPHVKQLSLIQEAVIRVREIANEYERVKTIGSGTGGKPQIYDASYIDALTFDHQMAVVMASDQYTRGLGVPANAVNMWRDYANGTLRKSAQVVDDFHNIWASTKPSMVAVSQLQYGKHDVRVGIEDQPLRRGGYKWEVLTNTLAQMDSIGEIVDPQLFVNGYGKNAFGDTHSLVLIVDSLLTHRLLEKLDNKLSVEQFDKLIQTAANTKAESDDDQGISDGNALETMVNYLGKVFNISQDHELKGNTAGNTWHIVEDKDAHTGRESLHKAIKKIYDAIDKNLEGKFEIIEASAASAQKARTDFGHFLALDLMGPFVLQDKNGELNDLWQTKHGDLYQQWLSDKQAIEQGKPPLYYSDEWFADRLELVQLKNKSDKLNLGSYQSTVVYEDALDDNLDVDNADDFAAFGRDENSRFRLDDQEIDIRIAKTHADLNANKLERSIQFGASEKPNDLQGGEGVDHLYGGDKNDTLAGLAGRDHLEGGGGIDTYIIKDQDTIFDNDGKGKLVFEDGDAAHFVADGSANASASGSEATTHARPADEGKESVRWVSVNDAGEADGRFVAERIGDDLLVRSTKNGNDRAMVKNYFLVAKEKDSGWSGVLGLHLGRSIPEEEEPEAEYNLMIGDQVAPFQSDGKTYDWSATRWNYQTGELEGSVAKKDFPDVLRGTTGKDLIRGLGGNDALYGSAGEDILYGNGGHDLLVGGTGSDKLYGEAGDDVMLGASTLMDYVRWRDVYSKGGLPKGMTYTYQNGGVWGLYQDPRKTIKTIAGALIDEIKDDSNTRGDLLIGGEGQDMIFGSHEHDRIYGGMAPDMEDTDTGADAIWGLGGDDEIYGGAGDDVIRGDGKDDPTLFGYTPRAFHGNDRIYAGAGNDTVFAYGGDDFVDAGDGHDYVYGHTGNDYIVGGAGNDFLIGDDNIDSLKPGLESGDDIIFGNEGEDRILGGKGNDLLYGNEGNDIIFGSEGDDELQGGDGDDILSGDNVHGPNEHGEMSGNDILHGGGGDDSLYGGKGDDHLLGDGGTDALYGNEGNDILRGGDGIDGLYGNEGDDILYGDAGNDQLTGGTGSDQLHGGAGADRYFFTAVDMQDGEKDIIHDDGLGENGMPDLIMLDGAAATGFEWTFDADQKRWDSSTGWTLERKNGSTLNLHHESSSGVIQLTDYQEGDYGLVLPDFNTPVTPEDPNPEDPQNPQPPSSGAPLAAQSIDEKQALSFTVPESAFQSGKDDPLVLSAQLADGKPLPAWLTFDSASRTFSGTPGNDDVGTLNIELSAKGKGGTASQRFTLNILNVNDAPQAGEALADVQAERGKPLTYVLPANAFTDIDKDDTLTLSATLDNGDALPAWLNFDAAQARFTGTPPVDAQTAYRIVLTATDKAGESVSQNFALTIHSAPQVGTENHDKIWGKATNDRIDGGAGNDKIYGGEGDDEINGGADNDALWGNAGNDILRGGEGDDYLSGEDGDDILEGGAGNDLLSAGKGNDIYRFSGDFGRDTVRNLQGKDDGGGHDALEFTDLRLEDIIFEKNNFSGLIIKNRKNSALVSVDNYFLNDGKSPYHIDEIRLADGHTLDYATVKAKAYQSTDGDDLVWGDDGDNTLHGGLGDDTLHGGDGNDQLQGDSGNDKLFGYSGNDRLIGGQGNDYMLAGTGNNTLLGGEGNDNLRSNAGNDILAGGTGHDSLNGGAGDDLYIYRQGDGRDFIIDQGGSDILFLPDFDQNQFSQHLVRQGQNLELRLDAANSLTLHNFFAGDHAIEHIAFSDGSHLSVAEIHQQFGEKYQGSPAPYDHNRVLDEFSKISSIL